jgi:uncharacterized cupredoxin-like copper-binding protein
MLEMAQLRMPAVTLGALAVAIGGCGGGSDYGGGSKSSTSSGGAKGKAAAPAAGGSAGGAQLKLEADEDGGLYFKPKALSGKAGAVTLVMTNPKTTGKEHGIAVKGNGIDQDGPVVKPGGTAKVTATLKPGKYTFYCNYENHAQRGMKGTLTVK